jgi:hypothetical protein
VEHAGGSEGEGMRKITIEAPLVVDEADWKEVTLRVYFDSLSKPKMVRVDTTDLTIAEEAEILDYLRGRA